jgi:acetyl esterase
MTRLSPLGAIALAVAPLAALAQGTPETETTADTPSAEMQAVLDRLQSLGADPIGTLPPEEQRMEPTPADAVAALMEDRDIAMDPALAAILTRDITIPGAAGDITARVYTPPEGEGPFPLVVYFHGGGWVIATNATYDASARALSAGADAVVVSVEYRKAPEAPFPAAHEDANAAYEWIVENSGELNADAERLAVAGESAGGNLALNVAMHARDLELTQPDHMLLVYPVAGDDMETTSYRTYADAQPLSRDAMMWFVENVFEDPAEAADPRIDLIAHRDLLAGLPPATVINATIDPLQTEGRLLAGNLQAAGVETTHRVYEGVTHEFFGMGAVVPAAQEAMDFATGRLSDALAAQ